MDKESLTYGERWKRSVDRTGPEWIEYCEGVFYVRRYLRTKLRGGKDPAVAEFDETCALYQRTASAHRATQLREVFRNVWESDRADLLRQILEEDAYAHAAPIRMHRVWMVRILPTLNRTELNDGLANWRLRSEKRVTDRSRSGECLECATEETDQRGRKKRTAEAKDSGRGIPLGSPISPLLSNLYMRRFVLAWKKLGLKRSLGSRIITYADDLVILCKNGKAEEALA